MKVRGALRQADWLRELDGLLLAGVVVSGLVGLAGVIAVVSGQPVEVAIPGGAVLRVADPTGAQLGLATLAAVPSYVLTTAMLVLLWRLVRAARRTDPFTAATIRRLRALGGLLLIGGPAVCGLEFLARFALTDTVSTAGASASLDLSVPAVWALAGFGFLAIGEVVRRGEALRAELDEVV